MDRLFGEVSATQRTGVFPPLNIYDDGESLVVKAEVPGIDPADLEINATVNALTIKGERKRPTADDKASFHRRERSYGTFSRSVNLPQEINSGKVQASYKHGVLEIMLPKAEESKPHKIEIRS
ncbi:MAG: Hsp20/alpha crystallin family protein [Myxococcota bacterium]|nr:Hsp20/alpha crystallin family protein [Myxococcota bacterium]